MRNGQPALVMTADPDMRDDLITLLRRWGYGPIPASSVDEALTELGRTQFALTVVDIDSHGLDLLRRLRLTGGDRGPIIALCDGNLQRVAEAATLGADTVVHKPVNPDELEHALWEACARRRGKLAADDPAARLRQEIALWRSPRMQEVWKIIEQAATVDITILIVGETGTGKDLAARAIHYLSARQDKPFVKVNCAAVPRELLESELFGHERGAFTGAHQLKLGKFEAANHGAIFLDEIGDLHPALQGKLLQVLQDGEFSRVGGKATIKVDCRVIAATNQNLEKAVAAGRFREDLYYRLNVIQIALPPLRERPEEIPLLLDYFLQRYSRLFNREGFAVLPEMMERLVEYSYPGNVRELENLVKRMIVLGDPLLSGSPLWPGGEAGADAKDTPAPAEPTELSLKAIAREAAMKAERQAIQRALEETHWNRVKAARLLQISYRALLYKIKGLGIENRSRPAPLLPVPPTAPPPPPEIADRPGARGPAV